MKYEKLGKMYDRRHHYNRGANSYRILFLRNRVLKPNNPIIYQYVGKST
jgi:hypothetical protein